MRLSNAPADGPNGRLTVFRGTRFGGNGLRRLGRLLFAGLMVCSIGCQREQEPTLECQSDAQLQQSVGRLAARLPEAQRERFVRDLCNAVFTPQEQSEFAAVPHNRRPGVVYIPQGRAAAFERFQGMTLAQLRQAIFSPVAPVAASPEPGRDSPTETPPPQAVTPNPMTNPASNPGPDIAQTPPPAPGVSQGTPPAPRRNPFASGGAHETDEPNPAKTLPEGTTPPLAVAEPTRELAPPPRPASPRSPAGQPVTVFARGRVAPRRAEGFAPILAGRQRRYIEAYELARSPAEQAKLVEQGDIVRITEATEVIIEASYEGWVYVRLVDRPQHPGVFVIRVDDVERQP